jgi:hypothetical protein
MDSQDFIRVVPLHSSTSFSLLAYPIVRNSEHSTEELALYLSLRLDVRLRPKLVLSEIWARGTCIAHIYDHHQAIGLVAVKEEACKD